MTMNFGELSASQQRAIEASLIPGSAFDFTAHTVTMRDPAGNLVKMDLGQSTVHIDHALTNFLTGYSNGTMQADMFAPPVIVANASNKYFQWDPDNALAAVDGTVVASNGDFAEITPKLSNSPYNTVGYALGSRLPTEIISNADAPLNVLQTATRMVMDRLLLNRELRVKTLAFTAANYATANVQALLAAQKWNGGGSSDPIRNIQAIVEASLMPVTHMIMSKQTWNAFITNPAVQKYVAFKTSATPIPSTGAGATEWSALLDLPIPIIAESRAKDPAVAASYPYVWNGSVALLRRTPGDMSDADICTAKTFRWNGAGGTSLPTEFGGKVEGGWTVRSFFDPFKGRRGTQTVVVTHDDAEVITGGTSNVAVVGGLITGAYV